MHFSTSLVPRNKSKSNTPPCVPQEMLEFSAVELNPSHQHSIITCSPVMATRRFTSVRCRPLISNCASDVYPFRVEPFHLTIVPRMSRCSHQPCRFPSVSIPIWFYLFDVSFWVGRLSWILWKRLSVWEEASILFWAFCLAVSCRWQVLQQIFPFFSGFLDSGVPCLMRLGLATTSL